jgi:hypothetical protein
MNYIFSIFNNFRYNKYKSKPCNDLIKNNKLDYINKLNISNKVHSNTCIIPTIPTIPTITDITPNNHSNIVSK